MDQTHFETMFHICMFICQLIIVIAFIDAE